MPHRKRTHGNRIKSYCPFLLGEPVVYDDGVTRIESTIDRRLYDPDSGYWFASLVGDSHDYHNVEYLTTRLFTDDGRRYQLRGNRYVLMPIPDWEYMLRGGQ